MLSFFTVRVMAYICAGLGIAIVVLLAVLWAAGVRIDAVKLERDRAKDQLVAAQRTIKGQEIALKECSDRTDALRAEGVKRQVAADQALLRAQQEARKYQVANQKRAALLSGPTPSGAGCSQALSAIRRDLRK